MTGTGNSRTSLLLPKAHLGTHVTRDAPALLGISAFLFPQSPLEPRSHNFDACQKFKGSSWELKIYKFILQNARSHFRSTEAFQGRSIGQNRVFQHGKGIEWYQQSGRRVSPLSSVYEGTKQLQRKGFTSMGASSAMG